MPFNRFLGLTVVTLDTENVSVKVKMKEGLIGNFIRGMIYGGVISSLIDIIGGFGSSSGNKKDGGDAR